MRLCIRAQDLKWFSFALADESGHVQKCLRIAAPPESVFASLVKTLQAWEMTWEMITSIGVVTGPGSYTAMRTSITIANTIAFARHLPLCGAKGKAEATDESVFLKLAKGKAKIGPWILPAYGAKPMITKAKNKVYLSA